jgi:hypothetical protein
LSFEFEHSKSNHCIYYKNNGDNFLFIALYVDNMLFIGKGKVIILELKSQLPTKFEMKYLGATKQILGMKIKRDRVKKSYSLAKLSIPIKFYRGLL